MESVLLRGTAWRVQSAIGCLISTCNWAILAGLRGILREREDVSADRFVA